MKSLLSNYLVSVTGSWSDYHSDIDTLASGKYFPAEIEGLHGTSASFFIADFVEKMRNKALSSLQYGGTGRHSGAGGESGADVSSMDAVVVVPAEKDAFDLQQDFETAFDGSVEIKVLPWWGIVPYRTSAVGTAVFGQRSAVLSKMAMQSRSLNQQTKPRIFIINQRSLQTPVPSPEYVRSLSFSLYKGEKIDPVELSKKLSSLGYVRVPKVGVPGEFTLRGEVLDVFAPGEERAGRILFDFDEIESIKSFDVETQSTIPAESRENLLVYPMKEVVWNPELVEKLGSLFDKFGQNNGSEKMDSGAVLLALGDEAQKSKEKIISDLKEKGESEGEELFYLFLWGKENGEKYIFLDYI